jgi:hypothetical protein
MIGFAVADVAGNSSFQPKLKLVEAFVCGFLAAVFLSTGCSFAADSAVPICLCENGNA